MARRHRTVDGTPSQDRQQFEGPTMARRHRHEGQTVKLRENPEGQRYRPGMATLHGHHAVPSR